MVAYNLDIAALRSVIATNDLGSMSHAAEQLNMTQSAISMQVKRLEDRLGQQIFRRAGRGLRLTNFGEQLVAGARDLIANNDALWFDLTSNDCAGEVAIAVTNDLVAPVIPKLIAELKRDCARISLRVSSGHSADLQDEFARGKYDAAISSSFEAFANIDQFRVEELGTLPIEWVGARGGSAHLERPITIVAQPSYVCMPTATHALDDANIPWQMADNAMTESEMMIRVAVEADQGVATLLPSDLSEGMEIVTDLPSLPTSRILLQTRPRASAAVDLVASRLREHYSRHIANANAQ